MLIYKDTQAATRRNPPPWLDGAVDLLSREDRSGAVRYWGIGNAHLIGERKDWVELEDGWMVAAVGPIDPRQFQRTMRWCRIVEATDTQGRAWSAPVILSSGGERVILVSYGRDFQPVLTAEQQRGHAIATEARSMLVTAYDRAQAAKEAGEEAGEEADGIDTAAAAAWTAELLSLTHHVSVEVLGALGLIDDALTLAVLSPVAGLRLKVQVDE